MAMADPWTDLPVPMDLNRIVEKPKLVKPETRPIYRVTTASGAVISVRVNECHLDFRFSGGILPSTLRLEGEIIDPTDLPAFREPEAERKVTVPE